MSTPIHAETTGQIETAVHARAGVRSRDHEWDEALPSPCAATDGVQLSRWQMAIFVLPVVPLSFLAIPILLFLPTFYGQVLHLGLAQIGTFLLLARMADVFIDPLIGRWSDTVNIRFGRRKTFMLLGTPLLIVGAYMLFLPPSGVTSLYLLFASFVIYLASSTIQMPFQAWGTDLVGSYDGRSQLIGYQGVASAVGTVIAALVPAFASRADHGIDRFTMGAIGTIIMILLPISVLAAVISIEEPKASHAHVQMELWSSLATVARNKPFIAVWTIFVLLSVGQGVQQACFVFYVSDYLKRPEWVGSLLLIILGLSLATIPLWSWISMKIGKHVGAAVAALTSILYGLLLATIVPSHTYWPFVVLCLAPFITPGLQMLPTAIVGDVIDYDTLKTGQSRGGAYWGLISLAQKLSPAISLAAALPALQFLGYRPAAHGAGGLQALRYLFALGTIPFMALGAYLCIKFPIDGRRHRLIRQRIEARERRSASANMQGASNASVAPLA